MTVLASRSCARAVWATRSDRTEDLARIQDAGIAAAIWHRTRDPGFAAWIDALPPDQLPRLRALVAVSAVESAEQTYAPNQPYSGATKFAKHYTRLVGDLLPTGEEFDCAVHLDRLDKVRYWIRNIDRKKSSFWLQLPHDKFYPDFVAMLTDGRILVVEYKGGHLYESEAVKRQIGAVWAEASGRQCLFCMPTNRGFDLINQTIG